MQFYWIILNGKTYTHKLYVGNNLSSIDELEVIIEPMGIVECIDKKLDDGVLELKIKSLKEGKAHIEITALQEYIDYHSVYVHKFGVITYDNYFGKSTGGEIIPISVVIFLAYILYISIKKIEDILLLEFWYLLTKI